MTGDCHVRICEGRGVRFPPATRRNQRCEPFVWTKDANTILAKADRETRSSNTRH